MADWWKKNIILSIIGIIQLLVITVISIGATRFVDTVDGKAEKTEVEIFIEEARNDRDLLRENHSSQYKYIDAQNTKQDEALEKRLIARDKINEIILEELSYIKRRVDRIPTK